MNDADRAILPGWSEGSHTRRFKAAVIAAGLSSETTFYCLRHTYITRHLTAGVPVSAIADQCGTSAKMIEQSYAHYLGDDLERWFSLGIV